MSRQELRGCSYEAERGFTILEALIATAIVSLIAFVGLAACKTIAHVMLAVSAANPRTDGITEQAAQLRDDASSAFAVFVPGTDMYGRPNAGQELDFYSKADDGGALRWRYFYDAAQQTLARTDYDANGTSGVRDVRTGVVDPAAAYPPLDHVTRFSATTITADRLGDDRQNIYGGIGGLFARAPRALPVAYDDAAPGVPAAVGGNGVVQIVLAGAAGAGVVHLAAGSMPAGFTVTGLPLWHAVVYRVDQSHRFLLGPAGKSHVFINARVDVSYDHWATKAQWCDFNLLGKPDGLDPHDPHADYKPTEAIEQSDAVLAGCRQRHPLPPPRGSAGYPSDDDAIEPPLPGQTPPPCWTQPGPGGRCWPADAPPDWVPPSPFPAETPPPDWCFTHAASAVCGPARAPR